MPLRNNDLLRRGEPSAAPSQAAPDPGLDALGLRREPREQAPPGPLDRPATPREAFDIGTAAVRSALPATASALLGSVGARDSARRLADTAAGIQEEAQLGAGRMLEFTELRDPETGRINWDNAARWGMQTLAAQGPNLAFQAAGGAAGGILRAATQPRAVTAAQRLAQQRQVAASAVAGGATAGGMMMAGDIVPRLQQDPGAEDMDQATLSRMALAGSVAGGALQAIPVANVVSRLGIGRVAAEGQARRHIAREMAGAVGSQVVREVPVDIAQVMISRGLQGMINEDVDLFDDEGLAEMVNAAAASTLTSIPTGAAAAGGGRIRSRMQQRQRETEEHEHNRSAAERRHQRLNDVLPERSQEWALLAEEGLDQPVVQRRLAAEELSYARSVDPRTTLTFTPDVLLEGVTIREHLASERDTLRAQLERTTQDLSDLRNDRWHQDRGQRPAIEELEAFVPMLERNVQHLERTIETLQQGMDEGDTRVFLDALVDTLLNQEADLTPELLAGMRRMLEPVQAQVSDLMRVKRSERGDEISDLNDVAAAMTEQDAITRETVTEEGLETLEGIDWTDRLEAQDSRPPAYMTDPQAPGFFTTYQSPEASRQLHGVAYTSDAGSRHIESMQRRYPDDDFDLVSLREAVEAQAVEQGALTREVIDAHLMDYADRYAARLAERTPAAAVLDLYDPNAENPGLWLDNFNTVRRYRLPDGLGQGDAMALTPAEVDQVLREPTQAQRDAGEMSRGDIAVQVAGRETPMRVNMMGLAQAMIPKVPVREGTVLADGSVTAERVADLVMEGLGSLARAYRGVEIRWDSLPDSLVVFTASDGREFTWGEVSRHGAARLRARAEGLERRIAQLEPGPVRARLAQEHTRVRRDLERARYAERRDRQQALAETHAILSHPERYSSEAVESARAAQARLIAERVMQREEQLNRAFGEEPVQLVSDEQTAGGEAGGLTQQISRLRWEQAEALRTGDNARVAALEQRLSVVRERLERAIQEEREGVSLLLDDESALSARAPETAHQADVTGPELRQTRQEMYAQARAEREAEAAANEAYATREQAQPYTEQLAEPPVDAPRTMTQEGAQAMVSTWASRLGLETRVQLLTRDQLDGLVEPSVLAAVDRGDVRGFATPTTDGVARIYVDEQLSDVLRTEHLAHELGHVVFRERVEQATDAQAEAVMEAFHRWRRERDHDTAPVEDIYRSKQAMATLTASMEAYQKGARLSELSDVDRAYLLDYSEWFADNTARWLTQTREPRTVVQRFFKQVADQLQALYQAARGNGYRADRRVAGLLRGMWTTTPRDLAVERSVVRSLPDFSALPELPRGVRRSLQRLLGPEGATWRDALAAAEASKRRAFSEDTEVRIRRAFDRLLTSEERRILGQAFTAPYVRRQLRRLLPTATMVAIDNGNARKAVSVGYQLWSEGSLTLGPQANTPFARMSRLLEDVFGIISEDTRAHQVLEALHQGHVAARQAGLVADPSLVQRFRGATRLERAAATTVRVVEAFGQAFRYVRPASSRLMLARNPRIEAIVDAFYPRVGSEGRSISMFEARVQRMGEYHNAFARITEELTQDQGAEVLQALQARGTARDPVVQRAVEQVRAQLRRMWGYGQNRGLSLGDRGEDYFPWVFDTDALMNRRQEFINLIDQDKYAGQAGVTSAERQAFANRTYDALMSHDGYGDSQLTPADGGHTPFMASANERTLAWITGLGDARDAERLATFFSKDIGQTLAVYTEQIVKRAEFASAFGLDGSRLEQMIAEARQMGATDAQIQDVRHFVSAMMGTMGRELHPALRRVIEATGRVFGQDWSDVDPRRFRQVQGAVIVYQNIRVLGLATLTSLADAAGIITRADSADVALAGFKAGLDELVLGIQARTTGHRRSRSDYRSELRRLAESMGTIDMHLVNQVLGEAFSGNHLTGTARRTNEWFFRAIQLQRWTRMSRMMGLASGRQYLVRLHDRQGVYDRHYERFMDQLGLREGDIQLDVDRQLVVLDAQQIEALQAQRQRLLDSEEPRFGSAVQRVEAEIQRDARIRTALNRYVDQAVMRPNASQRPLIGSHPDAALLMHLKQFAYSIQTQIVNRVMNEAGQGNYYPLMAVMSYVPIMVAADLLRERIQHGLGGDERKRFWTFWDYVADAIHRSGMTGLGSFLLDVRKDRTQFGGVGYESLQGPAISQLQELIRVMNGSRELSAGFVNALPANNIYKNWGFDSILDAPWDTQTGVVSGGRY